MALSKETKIITPEKAEELFLDRLVELLLRQVEEEAIADLNVGTNLQAGVVSESPEITKPADNLLVVK